MADAETTVTLVVQIDAYGNPATLDSDLLLRTARALYHGVKPGVRLTVLAADDPLLDAIERRGGFVTLDPKGDDLGHHPGHDAPLVPVESCAPAAAPFTNWHRGA